MPRLLVYLLAALLFLPLSLRAQSTAAPQAMPDHDGQHDFDFEFGSWTAHLKRLLHPLSGSNEWVEYDGTSVVRRVWDGRANLGELEVDGPKGHIEGITLRLFHPESHQWMPLCR